MGQLSTFIIVAMLMASVSGFFKGKSHSEPSEHYEWSVAPKYETIHVQEEHQHQHQEHYYEKSKKDKKWSWLPSWPWKKNKEPSHQTHYKTKYPVYKIQKFKGVKVHPVEIIHHTSTPVHETQPIIYHHHSSPIHETQHITHSKIIEEIPSSHVYHHETVPQEIYHHEVLKEVPSPVYHHEIHTETSHHEAPIYHHPVKEEVHHEEISEDQKWKWPEIGASQWAQLETHHSSIDEQSNEEATKEIIASFLGEGHSIDTLEKLMPTLHKDKNLFNKLKQFHQLKSWLPTLKKAEEHHQHGHEDKKSKTLFNFLPNIFSKPSVEHHEPQVVETHEHYTHHEPIHHTAPQHFPEIHAPVLQSFHEQTIPYIPVAYPIHQTVSTTVIEHPKKVYQIEHYKPNFEETKKEEQINEQHNSHEYGVHSSHQLHNSYGEPIPNDSYSSASDQTEVVVPAPTHNAEHQTDVQPNNQDQDSITLKSNQPINGTK